ncbi:zona pellucida sperm-binding protein 2 [Rhinophrynus dorsalis]
MEVEVAETKTKPKLNLTTVRLRDGSCKPSRATQNSLLFRVPLNACGTSVRSVGNKLLYENEIHALWKDFPPRRISRDSEYRLTVYCFYDVTGDKNISINIVTHPPFASSKNDGPLSLILNLYPDGSYGSPYSDIQYPVVKTLREPIYLEVQVLNRNDPNIELVLDDCWATMSSNPHDLPQWNVVVDGCQEERDNVQTVFHPVGSNVAQPSHRKRFEVKTFAFVLRGEASTGLHGGLSKTKEQAFIQETRH